MTLHTPADTVTATAMRRALDMISTANALTLPIDVWRIAAHHRIKVRHCSQSEELLERCTLTAKTSRYDAVSTKRRGKYFIFLSDDLDGERAKYAIAHELGHIVMGHLDIDVPQPTNDEAEEHADLFARILLAPPPILEQYDVTCPADLRHVTGLSFNDSRKMYALLEQYRADQREAERCEDIERRVRYQMKRKRRR